MYDMCTYNKDLVLSKKVLAQVSGHYFCHLQCNLTPSLQAQCGDFHICLPGSLEGWNVM